MGKRKSSSSYTSKGIVGRSMRTPERNPARIMNNKWDAWKAGKNVVLTIENPDKTATNARFIKVNARDVWGHPFRKGKNENSGKE